MKYRILMFNFIFVIVTLQLFSQPVSKEVAKTVAKNYYKRYAPLELTVLKEKHQSKGKLKKSESFYKADATIKETYVKHFNEHISYYVTTFKNSGFVIVSGHKAKGPVLVHSASGRYDPDNLPPAFVALMNDYDIVIDSAFINKERNEKKLERWNNLEKDKPKMDLKSGNHSGTYPDYLLTTEWGQTQTNNNDCPGYNSHPEIPNSSCGWSYCNHCAAGCVAVAVAQIMNYWEFAKGNWADFEWWNMPYPGLYSTDNDFDEEQEAVAYLLKRIGDRVDMDYCSNGCASGAYNYCPWWWIVCDKDKDGESALIYFGYNENSINFERKSWHTYNAWVGQLRDEINAERPVLYGVEGHSLIVDGYNSSNDNFHWNFGWNGDYNDIWVDFEDLAPGGHDYTNISKHDALIGIKPNIDDNINLNNKTISNGMNKTYYVKNNISASNFDIENNAKCIFIAGNEIVLSSGFEVEKGGKFEARVYTNDMIE